MLQPHEPVYLFTAPLTESPHWYCCAIGRIATDIAALSMAQITATMAHIAASRCQLLHVGCLSTSSCRRNGVDVSKLSDPACSGSIFLCLTMSGTLNKAYMPCLCMVCDRVNSAVQRASLYVASHAKRRPARAPSRACSNKRPVTCDSLLAIAAYKYCHNARCPSPACALACGRRYLHKASAVQCLKNARTVYERCEA